MPPAPAPSLLYYGAMTTPVVRLADAGSVYGSR